MTIIHHALPLRREKGYAVRVVFFGDEEMPLLRKRTICSSGILDSGCIDVCQNLPHLRHSVRVPVDHLPNLPAGKVLAQPAEGHAVLPRAGMDPAPPGLRPFRHAAVRFDAPGTGSGGLLCAAGAAFSAGRQGRKVYTHDASLRKVTSVPGSVPISPAGTASVPSLRPAFGGSPAAWPSAR